MGAFKKISGLWAAKSADHNYNEWAGENYEFDQAPAMPGMNNYPLMIVNARTSDALATLDWMNVPYWAQAGSHAYVLSTRRIAH